MNVISHKEKLRQQLADSQERLSFVLESAGVGIWDLNLLNGAAYLDERCRQYFGFDDGAQIVYEMLLSRIHPADQDKVQTATEEAIDPAKRNVYDVRYRTVGSSTTGVRWVHSKGRTYFNPEGKAYRFAGTTRDITNEVHTALKEQQLLSLVNYNVDLMSIADMSGKLLYMNEAGRNLLGVPPSVDIQRMTAADFYEEDELRRVQNTIIQQIDHSSGWKGILKLMNWSTKEIIPCQVSYILIKNPLTGEIIGRGATARDLRMELKARAELHRLATIVEISEGFCNYTDLAGNTIYINAAGQKLIGVDPNYVQKANIYSYHSPDSALLIGTTIMAQLLKDGKWSGSLELKHLQTGELIPIHKQLFIIRDQLTGAPAAIAGIARDLRAEINARKAIDLKNAELRQAVQELEFLANAVPAVVWTANSEGQLDYVNERWYERSAVSIAECFSQGWTVSMHPDDLAHTTEVWKHCLITGKPYQVEFRLKDKQGSFRWWLVRALALRDNENKIIKWYGTNTDITQQKELERQKDNFLAAASHELKTPVTSIKASAQILQSRLGRTGDEKNVLLLTKMDRQVNRLTALVEDLLDVTKISSGKLQLHILPFDFNMMVAEAIGDVQAGSHNHRIESTPGALPVVSADRDRICQVVINLLTNAVKYSPKADHVIVSTLEKNNEIQVSVQDFGIGLTEDKQELIFQQFYRVSGTMEHAFPGLGLGLYISSEIIKQMRGRIWVESAPGQGSTFSFAIPVSV